MSQLIDPVEMDGQPLVQKAIGTNDFVVTVLGHVIGRIVARRVTSGRVVWFWLLSGPHLPMELQPSHGAASTQVEAETTLQAKFEAWLAWAKASGNPANISLF